MILIFVALNYLHKITKIDNGDCQPRKIHGWSQGIIALQSTLWPHYMESLTHATHQLGHERNCAILDFRSRTLSARDQWTPLIPLRYSQIHVTIFPPMAKLLHTLINLQHPTVPLFALAKSQRSKRQLSKSFELVSQPLWTRLIKPLQIFVSFPGFYLYFRTAPKVMEMRS